MTAKNTPENKHDHRGVIFNAYPDSIGSGLGDAAGLLGRPAFQDAFALFYILPTFFNSDLDRGFSVVDYNLNNNLVSPENLESLRARGMGLKLDLVLNHLSVNSPQFRDLWSNAESSQYGDFFIDWNRFWRSHGSRGPEGYIIPSLEHLQKLFLRKPGLPVMKIRFPDGSDRFFWNTFYQEVSYQELSPADFKVISGLSPAERSELAALVNRALGSGISPEQIELGPYSYLRDRVIAVAYQHARYRGQLDLNARSERVWDFYEETLAKLGGYGAVIVRLDAFAYLHKEPGRSNFFNRPETWEYLERLRSLARKYNLAILPEIHSEYGSGLHEEIATAGYPIYDFFFPGLVIDALERGTGEALLAWIGEITSKDYSTINMLGCHDGIPVLDLRGKGAGSGYRPGLLTDEQIDGLVDLIVGRGGRIKNLYGPGGSKVSYYQVNATFFSALGEDERKLLLARAIQLFMPGTPQVWYLDLFAGKNNYKAADSGGPAGHKEINRTNLGLHDIERGLKQKIVQDQLEMIRLRNTSPAFGGTLEIKKRVESNILQIGRHHRGHSASLTADLRGHTFRIEHQNSRGRREVLSYNKD